MKMVNDDDIEANIIQFQEGCVDDISNYANNEFHDTCIA
jgi:hypothetical protein